jgi:hypothetical protein
MMNARLILATLAGAALVAGLLFVSLHSQRTLESGLPPLTRCVDEAYARIRAGEFAAVTGGSVVTVLGTGSMAPYIPASARGRDPLTTATALAVTAPGATFSDVTPGALCLYRHAASAVGMTMHGAARKSGAGWVMSGLNNARSDITMSPANFVGIVAQVFTWPQ